MTTERRVAAPSLPVRDMALDPRIVLRDGTITGVRPTGPGDLAALEEFFQSLSPDSRYRRFFSRADAPQWLLQDLSDSSQPARAFTLVAERAIENRLRIIAVASYVATVPDTAEVSFAVADEFQGKGLATALLERLAVHASEAGIGRFVATTLGDNQGMLDVFRDSGFTTHSQASGGVVEVELSLDPSVAGVEAEEERTRVATAASLRPLLQPGSVAVIGASRDPSSIGRRVVDALVTGGYRGSIYAVNRHGGEIPGARVYPSARDLPTGVDLAVIAVPAPAVLGVVDECASAGVRSLVVITAGFAEMGSQGRALQDQLRNKVRGYGMRLVGPNCMGVLNADPGVRLNASFSPVFPPGGHIGLMSQSGALGLAILELAAGRQLGLSTFVSAGNKADVSGNDLLEYWDRDPATQVILLYLESFGNARRFGRLARRITRRKPIVVVKSGRTREGSRAASSHTAALAASDVAVDALFRQSGVIRADTLDEMLDVAACLDMQPLPRGRRVGIVTNAGGPGILAADACQAAGLVLAELSSATVNRLADALPPMANRTNPVDMIASARPEHYRRTIETMLGADEVDSLIVIFIPIDLGTAAATVRAIREGVTEGRKHGGKGKPALSCMLVESGRAVPLELEHERLPSYIFPENAVRALGKVTGYAVRRGQKPGKLWTFDDVRPEDARAVCRTALQQRGDGWLTDDEVRAVLQAYRLPLVDGAVARNAEEAVEIATKVGFPVVAKLSSLRVQHKTELGVVRVGLHDPAAVRSAFEDIRGIVRKQVPAAAEDGILIQRMLPGGIETMMGITSDPVFGPLVGFGLGGINVEIFGDVRFRIAPLTDRDVDGLLHETRGFPLLEGYRGHPPADLPALREALLRLSLLGDDVHDISELDLNPVFAMPPGQGCRVVDARIRVRNPTRVDR